MNFKLNRFNAFYIYTAHPIVFFYITNNFIRVAFILEYEYKSTFPYSTWFTLINMIALNIILIVIKMQKIRPAILYQ